MKKERIRIFFRYIFEFTAAGFVGWLYEVAHGATTIWERWNSVMEDGSMNPDGMNSLNHYAYGSVAEFLYQGAGGLRPAKPGFSEAVIAPQIDARLGWVLMRYDSVNGTYLCSWKLRDDGQVEVNLTIPFGCRAAVTLPGYPGDSIALEAGQYTYCYAPIHDYRKVYTKNTTFARLLKDVRAETILKENMPEVVRAMQDSDENRTLTLNDLQGHPFLQVNTETWNRAVQLIENLKCPIQKGDETEG